MNCGVTPEIFRTSLSFVKKYFKIFFQKMSGPFIPDTPSELTSTSSRRWMMLTTALQIDDGKTLWACWRGWLGTGSPVTMPSSSASGREKNCLDRTIDKKMWVKRNRKVELWGRQIRHHKLNRYKIITPLGSDNVILHSYIM